MPKVIFGKWSVGFIIAMFALFLLGSSLTNSLYDAVPAGETIIADIISRPVLALSMLIGFGAGISAFITGLFSMIKHRERAVLVYGSTLIGAAVILFLIAEFVFPH